MCDHDHHAELPHAALTAVKAAAGLAASARPGSTNFSVGGYAGLIRHFASTVWGTPRFGKVLLTVWTMSIVGLVALPRKKRKAKKKPAAATDGKVQKQQKHPDGLGGLLRLLAPHLMTRHGAYLLTYVVSLCTRILITIKIATTAGRLTSFMSTRNWNEMFRTQAKFGCLCFLASFNTAAMKFLEKRCALSVRDILFKYLTNKLAANSSKVYYHLTLKDFPARLSDELSQFSTRVVHTLGHVLKPTIDVIILSAQLANNIGKLPLAVYYSFFWFAQWSLGRFKSRALPVALRECTENNLVLENRLHRRAAQLEEKREQVALLDATDTEREGLLADWRALKRHLMMYHGQNFFVDIVSNYVLKYGGAMCAYSILIPGIYLGDPGASESSVTAHYMTQTSLLISLANAVTDLNGAGNEMPRVRGLAERVWQFNAKMDECLRWMAAHPSPAHAPRGADTLRLQHVTVVPPVVDGTLSATAAAHGDGGAHGGDDAAGGDGNDGAHGPAVLYHDVTLEIAPGSHTVIQGENGAGKTSLFRTLRGLWPPAEENGQAAATGDGGDAAAMRAPVIELPEGSYFMPQDSVFGVGTLKAEILYPDKKATLDDATAVALLEEVGLFALVDKINTVNDWKQRLSGGQKQRMSWARMFHKRPSFAFVDEPSSAVDAAGVGVLFQAAIARGITLITISHSDVVNSYHSQRVRLWRPSAAADGHMDSGWRLESLS